MDNKAVYGQADTSYRAAGGKEGIYRLVTDFYDIMSTLPAAARIFAMHPSDLELSIDKLATFLCGWLGGPRLYVERYGGKSIPAAHLHLDIGPDERDAWLLCMKLAIDRQDFAEDFKAYLYQQLTIPAHRITDGPLGN